MNALRWKINKNFRTSLTLIAVILAVISGCKSDSPTDPGGENPVSGNATILTSLTATPNTIGVGGSARIAAIVVDENATPLAGKIVSFSTNGGEITPYDTTNAIGVAEAIYRGPSEVGVFRVYARLGEQVDSISVTIDSQIMQNLQVIPENGRILANGFSTDLLTISVWDTDQNPIANARVALQSNAGSLPPFVTTNGAGTAVAALRSQASKTDIAATIRATIGEIEAVSLVIFSGVSFSVEANPAAIIADGGNSTSQVRAILKETTSKIAVPEAEIKFGADLGTIPNAMETNTSGVAEVDLKSAIQTGNSMVIASYGEFIRDTVYVFMGQSIPAFLTLTTSTTELVADARSTAQLKAVVTDDAANPVPDGTLVQFALVEGSGTLETQRTTKNGVALSTLTSSRTPGTVRIAASVAGLSDTVTIQYTVGEAATILMSADSTSLPADGRTTTAIHASVTDAVGNPLPDGTIIRFMASFGDITATAETQNGIAHASFSAKETGMAEITASIGTITRTITIRLRPGSPNSILLTYDPTSLGVKDSGRNTTLTVTADVRDVQNNPVLDGSQVRFQIYASPGGGEFLSTLEPVPTINGLAHVSLNSGIRSGTVRIKAEVVDHSNVPLNPPIQAISTDVIIFAGPPYIATVNDRSTSRLSTGPDPVNIYGWHVVNNTTTIVAVIGDKYNNPVPEGTAVYFTTSGGIISTHTGYTNEEGVASVTLHSAQPYPTVPRFYETFTDPNSGHMDFSLPSDSIPGPIPDLEFGVIDNGYDNTSQNNGIARVLAVTEGVDANGNSAKVWGVTSVIFSGEIETFYTEVSDTVLSPAESAIITIYVYDMNGNPIVPGSTITLNAEAGKLSWSEFKTGDPGKTLYQAALVNNLDPTDPDAKEATISIGVRVESENGTVVTSTVPIQLKLN
ncbi:Ig-like domain-containing protein [candidate division KSB1 bacterium]|nr:Ig-like domain-containing protein [candidate division KSB1 bacterium]